jgi:hypothetical protein
VLWFAEPLMGGATTLLGSNVVASLRIANHGT